MAAAVTSGMTDEPAAGFVGRIPVRNLWLLMLYASDMFRMQGTDRVALERNLDDLPDLVGEILAHAVERRLRRRLNTSYVRQHAVISRVRGRIDTLTTERRRLLARGLVACEFDTLTVDTPRNRFVRAALFAIATISNPPVRDRCRVLANGLERIGITGVAPPRSQIGRERIGRNDASDRFMLAAALLAFDLALPTEHAGATTMARPDRDEAWARKLFEHAVAGFYAATLDSTAWSVRPGAWLHWQVERATSRIAAILPGMKTDIVLDDIAASRRIVIDTKFTQILRPGWHREESLQRDYLFQIYAYLESQTGQGDTIADSARGLLLHPSIGEALDEIVVIQGHAIRFATVDLAASTQLIRERLAYFCEPW